MDTVFMILFAMEIVVNFLVEKEICTCEKLIKQQELKSVAIFYFKGEFFFDLVTMLPIWELCIGKFSGSHYLLAIKVLRIKKGLSAISASSYIKVIRDETKKRVQRMIQSNHPDATSKLKDHTFIT